MLGITYVHEFSQSKDYYQIDNEIERIIYASEISKLPLGFEDQKFMEHYMFIYIIHDRILLRFFIQKHLCKIRYEISYQTLIVSYSLKLYKYIFYDNVVITLKDMFS